MEISPIRERRGRAKRMETRHRAVSATIDRFRSDFVRVINKAEPQSSLQKNQDLIGPGSLHKKSLAGS